MKDKNTILNILKEYPIAQKALRHIILTNIANNAPYHNLNHLLTVTRHAYEGLKFENRLDEFTEDILVACLFHDYNHSQGKEKDDINVKIAKEGMVNFLNSLECNPLDTDFMEYIIDATQYPYVIPSEDLCPYQKIIRDADLCQIYEYDWLKQNIFGLSLEMGIPVVDLLPGQIKFLENIEPLTDYGKYMYDKYFKSVCEEVEFLQKIINNV